MERVSRFNRTRIAPTPSGFLHLGNLLSFVITAGRAAATGASILLRIDDLDQERSHLQYIQDIFDTLEFMEIPWQEGPRNLREFEQEFSQVHRLPLYRQALKVLREQEALFACTCSRSQLQQQGLNGSYPGTCLHKNIPLHTEQVNWRLRTDDAGELSIRTDDGNRITAELPASMQYFIVRKKDDYPSYQLTSVIDDLHFGIDLIVRGTDLWPSTLAQHYLADRLQSKAFQGICFHHHELLTGKDGMKLSKSAGATSIQYLRKQGKSAADIYSLLAGMLGIRETVNNWQQLARQILAKGDERNEKNSR